MFPRTLGLVASAMLVLAACGGDESSGPQCMGSEVSMPGSANDPCPQDNPMCVAAGGKAFATCVDGQWSKKCECVTMSSGAAGSPGTSTAPVSTAPICGDKVIAATEACEGTNLNNATCQSLGYSGGGTLLCNPTTCTYDTIMCRMTVATTSGAGTSGGAGIGGGGTGN